GRTVVVRIAGTPPTVRPAACQTPSPGSQLPAGEASRAGTGSAWGLVCTCPGGSVNEPAGGLPPTLGGLSRYHSVSMRFTTPPSPCPRNHSAAREGIDVPYDGLYSAGTKLLEKTTRKERNARRNPARIRRYRRLRRRGRRELRVRRSWEGRGRTDGALRWASRARGEP